MTVSNLNIFLLISLSVILGMLSNILIERRVSGKNTIFIWLAVLGFTFIVYVNGGNFDARDKSQDIRNNILNTYKNYKMDPTGLFTKCNASLQMRDTGEAQIDQQCISSEDGGIFLWGDSHMGSLSTGLRYEIMKNTPFSQLTSSGCAPSFTMKRNGSDRFDKGCDYSNNIAYKAILNSKPKVVILGASSHHEIIDWEETATQLHMMGVPKVIVIGPFPQWQPSLPLIYVKRHMGEDFISDPNFTQSLLTSNDYLIDLQSKNDNFIFINMISNLCFITEVGELSCRVKFGESLLTFDYGHLTVEASKLIAKKYVLPFL
jgi:hypothetical protein